MGGVHTSRTVGTAAAMGLAAMPVLSAGPVAAWGAVAYSMTTRDFGYSYGFGSADAAKRRAIAECEGRSGAGDCKSNVAFNNGCGAVAWGWAPLGGDRKFFVYRGAAEANRAAAERAALTECVDALDPPLTNCEILVWACD